MITVYGSKICIDCRNFLGVMVKRHLEDKFQLVNISGDVKLLKKFLTLRDHEAAFAPCRTGITSSVGIPAFVKEDGTITLDVDEALAWLGEEPVKEEEILEK